MIEMIEKHIPSSIKTEFNKHKLQVRRTWNRYKAELDGIVSNAPLAGTAATPALLVWFLVPVAYKPIALGFAAFVAAGIFNAAFNSHGDHRTPEGVNLMGQTFQAKEQYKAYLFQAESRMIDLGEKYASLEREEVKAIKKAKERDENPAPKWVRTQTHVEETTEKFRKKKQSVVNRMGRIQRQLIDLADGVRIIKNPDPADIGLDDLNDTDKENFANRMIYHVPDIQHVITLGKQRMLERLHTKYNQQRDLRSASAEVEAKKLENDVENGVADAEKLSKVRIPTLEAPGRPYKPAPIDRLAK